MATLTYICNHNKLKRVTPNVPSLPPLFELAIRLVGSIASTRSSAFRLSVNYYPDKLKKSKPPYSFVVKPHKSIALAGPYIRAKFTIDETGILTCMLTPNEQQRRVLLEQRRLEHLRAAETGLSSLSSFFNALEQKISFNLADPDATEQIEEQVFVAGMGARPRMRKTK